MQRFESFVGSITELYRLIQRIKNTEMAPLGLAGRHVMCLSYLGSRPEDSPEEAAESFIRAIEAMQDRYGVPKTVSALRAEDIPRLARCADREANPLYPVPVLWDAGELEEIYRAVLEVKANGEITDRDTGAEPAQLFSHRGNAASGRKGGGAA